MIYIEDKDYNRQIDVLSFFQERGGYEIIIWLYPDKDVEDEICGLKMSNGDKLEGKQVTAYNDNIIPQRTVRSPLTNDLIDQLRNSKDIITSNCDSLAVYKPGEYELFLCAINHENMCLVNDNDYLEDLKVAGFNATKEKPSRW